MNKSKIKILLYQYLTFGEDKTTEYNAMFENYIDQDASNLVNYATCKNYNLASARDLLCAICKKMSNPKTKVDKVSTSAK